MRGGSNVLLSPEQVAVKLGVSRKTVYRRWQEWGLKTVAIGRMLRFRERDIDNFIDGTPESPNARDLRSTTSGSQERAYRPALPRYAAAQRTIGFGKDEA